MLDLKVASSPFGIVISKFHCQPVMRVEVKKKSVFEEMKKVSVSIFFSIAFCRIFNFVLNEELIKLYRQVLVIEFWFSTNIVFHFLPFAIFFFQRMFKSAFFFNILVAAEIHYEKKSNDV